MGAYILFDIQNIINCVLYKNYVWPDPDVSLSMKKISGFCCLFFFPFFLVFFFLSFYLNLCCVPW